MTPRGVGKEFIMRTSAFAAIGAIGLVVVLSLSAFACEEIELLGPTPDQMQEVVTASNAFAWKLFGQMAADSDENICFSPSSVHTALVMTYTGAGGETAKQMHESLSLPSEELMAHIEQADPPAVGTYFVGRPWDRDRLGAAYGELLKALEPDKDAKFKLIAANAIWGQEDYPWRDSFTDGLRDHFGASLNDVDFGNDADEITEDINDWVSDQTRGKIDDIMPEGELNEMTRLVLANAVYFKGKWATAFKKESTRPQPFHVSAEETVDVPTMFQSRRFQHAETDLMQIVRMPYRGDEVSMLIILPKARDGLAEVEAGLAEDELQVALDAMTPQQVDIWLPKFTFRWRATMNRPLKALGMSDAFDSSRADFSMMVDDEANEDLSISTVIHATFIEVDEAGTEAAAATTVSIVATSVPPPAKEFRADHPFIFAIRHEKTGLLLFVGRVVNPSEK
jgi:serpin B